MTLVRAVARSKNRKLGEASTTYAPQASCPKDCVFMNAGCYAERGYVGILLRNINKEAVRVSATTRDVADAEAAAIDAMEVLPGRPLRLHTVGDCATNTAAKKVAAAAKRFMARGGGKAWSYTHAWRKVHRSSWGDVSILASCETTADVKEAQERGYATALVVDKFESERRYEHEGVEIIPCPAQTRHKSCSDCGLCFDDKRLVATGFTIGFEIHGDRVTKNRARLSLNGGEVR